MTAVKQSSTIQANKNSVFATCPVTFVMDVIGGYWKPIILLNLLTGAKRYHELKKSIPGITEKMLVQLLRQLEEQELIARHAEQVVPPRVTYTLTVKGRAMRPILYAMAEWATQYGGEHAASFRERLDMFPE